MAGRDNLSSTEAEIKISETTTEESSTTKKSFTPKESTSKKADTTTPNATSKLVQAPFSIPKSNRKSKLKRTSVHHKVDYNHAPDHKSHYFSCACDTRINERVRKQRIEFSNDLHDIVVCMPSALDALKFEVLVGSKIDPVASTTDDQITQIEKETMSIKQQDRVEALMSDERDLSISRTLT